MPDLDKLTSNRFAVSYETFLRDCPQCGNAVPIGGPVSQVECPECRSAISIPKKVWDELLERIHMDWFDAAKFDVPERSPTEINDPQGRFKIEARRTLLALPPCIHCGVAQNDPSSGDCSSCGKPVKYTPLEKDNKGMPVTHICATELDTPANATPVELPQSEAAPVAMACPLCSANLQVTPDSPRTITCEYCGGAIFLPDALWRRFHPVKTVRRWATLHVATSAAFLRKAKSLGIIKPLLFSAVGIPVGVILFRDWHVVGFRLGETISLLAVFLLMGVLPAASNVAWSRAFFRAARRFRDDPTHGGRL